MNDAITCPDCGVNADTCRCALRWPHTSAMVREADQPGDHAERSLRHAWHQTGMRGRVSEQPLYIRERDGSHWQDENWCFSPYRPAAFTTDAAGRLTLRTP